MRKDVNALPLKRTIFINPMNIKNLLRFSFLTGLMLNLVAITHAAPTIINVPADLPPGVLPSGLESGNLGLDANIIAALIGVSGLVVGSLITILASYVMRWMDVRREDKREDLLMERSKKEKEYAIKQDIYRGFLDNLAHIETFQFKDLDTFKKEWTKMEIKIDLVASGKVRQAKDAIQAELLDVAEKNIRSGAASLGESYIQNRDALLKAIREDIDIFQS